MKRLPALAPAEACTGCTACRAACPQDALAMAPDAEGFLRPRLDVGKCVGCGACERACPILHPGEPDPAPTCLAVQSRDDALLRASASGALFTELARPVLAQGGVVFGCRWEEGSLTAIHAAAEDEAALAPMRGSKYVQSDPRDTFREARAALRAGRPVLYSGTPCQIAGLRGLLGHHPNLLAVEIICHSAPSPAVLRRAVEAIARAEGAPLTGLTFRDKTAGAWRSPFLAWTLADGRQGKAPLYATDYGSLFAAGIANRPSCHRCAAKVGASGADLTIGDFWGVENVRPELDDGRGLSVLAAHTQKGRDAAEALRQRADCVPLTPEEALAGNPRYFTPASLNPRRGWFMAHFRRHSLHRAVRRAVNGPWPIRLARRILSQARRLAAAVRSAIKTTRGGATAYASHMLTLPALA